MLNMKDLLISVVQFGPVHSKLIHTKKIKWDWDQYYAKTLTLTVGVHFPSLSPGPCPTPAIV